MKKLKKAMILFLTICVMFAAAGGASISAMAEEADADDIEELDLEDLEDWDDEDLEDWDDEDLEDWDDGAFEDWDYEDFEDWDDEDVGDWEFDEDDEWLYNEGEEEYSSETLEDGSLVETTTTTYESGDVLVESVTTAPDGNTLKEVFRLEGADGYVYSSEWEYIYDEAGILVSGKGVESETYPDNEENNVTQTTLTTYDEMGDILTSESEYTYGNGMIYKESWEYTYDEDGQCTSGIGHAEESDAEEIFMEMDVSETYNEFGSLLTQNTRYSYSDGSESTESWTYTYSEDGFLVSSECAGSETNPLEGTVSRTVSETYNEDGNLLISHTEYTYPENEG